MKELTLAFDDLEKVSGGNFVDELTEEDRKRYNEMKRKVALLYQQLPESQKEYSLAVKELTEYQIELVKKYHWHCLEQNI